MTRRTTKEDSKRWRVGAAPGALPVLGHALALRRTPLSFMTSLPAHGDLVRIKLGPATAYMVCAPDLVHQLLSRPSVFDKGGPIFDRARESMGNGLGTSLRSDHRRQRALMQPSFSPQRLADYAAVMQQEADRLTADWTDGQAFDVAELLTATTARITIRALLGAHLTDAELADLPGHLERFFHLSYRRLTTPLPALNHLPTPATRQFNESVTFIRALARTCIDRQRTRGGNTDSLLASLVGATTAEEGSFSDEELTDQIVTLFFAGVESSQTALNWTIYHLARHRAAHEALYRELDEVLAGHPVAYEHLPRLEHLDRCITESLRLTPPGWFFSRTVTEPAELAGHHLPAGTAMFWSPYLLHHLPDVFPDPRRYDPDRWLPERTSRQQSRALVPFGHGARKCIGDTFGITEATLVIATIASRWHLVPDPDAPPPRKGIGLTLNLRSFHVRAYRRKS
ncbi:cytochrome P450 [Streptomyces sp. WAC06614]|uniref:cytochrome P450 n=1 Tax=Streptomyces sp. WAC06614 TaxID=2487416 RepID=UPI00163BD9CE|nr:cytochrome P450 [Streptomyces sp. WAC06614]